jgi:putative ABC transport system permease protein
MKNFNLEHSITNWKRALSKKQHLEPGDIEELEGHLRDSIDQSVALGMNEKEAFKKAVSSLNTGFEEVVEEYRFKGSKEPKSKWFSSWWIPAMLPNVLKITVRNFKRQPGYSFINIIGLSIGIACALIIFLYVQDELSYDRFHEKADRIYRIDQTNIWANFEGKFASTGPGVAGVLKKAIPEIESTVRINDPADYLITIQNDQSGSRYFEESEVLSADSSFFEVFTMEFLEGNPSTSLKAPYSVVLTERTRERYFDNESGVGKTIRIGNPGEEISYQVTGVVKEMPKNSHFNFDLLTSLSSDLNVKRRENTWIWTGFVTYVLLNENASIESVRNKIPSSIAEDIEANLYSAFGTTGTEFTNSGRSWNMYFTPVTDIHLKATEAGNRIGVVSDIFYVYVFSAIALLIIALACINFMNLSSARSVYRAKEVGIRKTLGSRKESLIGQFLMESVLFAFISLIIAYLVVWLVIPSFNEISAKQLTFAQILTPSSLLSAIGIAGILGIIAGLYPALYLTSFNPIESFKSSLPSISQNKLSFSGLRNFLVVFQFAISVMLISCSIIIYQQLAFIQSTDLGFDKENILILENVEKIGAQTESLKQLLLQEAPIKEVAESNALPPNIWYEDFAGVYGSDAPEVTINSMVVDDDLISTMGFNISIGRAFNQRSESNAKYVILNQTAVNQLPWSDSAKENEFFPLGEFLLFGGNEPKYEVIGVVDDFNSASLHYDVLPLAIFHEASDVWAGPNRFLTIKFDNNANLNELIASVQRQWKSIARDMPFEFSFLDDQLYVQYQSEQRVAKVVSIFTALAIFIAILGLVGLISFSIEKKTKEIGVRKILGASTSNIILLLSKDLIKLILCAILIATPVAWFMMNNWLQDFVYRIDINFLVFLLSGFGALFLAWLALSYQTTKAALQNPVKSLRSD